MFFDNSSLRSDKALIPCLISSCIDGRLTSDYTLDHTSFNYSLYILSVLMTVDVKLVSKLDTELSIGMCGISSIMTQSITK